MKQIVNALAKMNRGNRAHAVFALCLTTAIVLPAQTFTTLHSFNGTDGHNPVGVLVQGSDGNFYGVTAFGGANDAGTVFKIAPGGTLSTLYSFCALLNNNVCTDGKAPEAGLALAANGDFYGTTSGGGANTGCPGTGCGTVFEIAPTGKLTTLYTFCTQPVDYGDLCTDGASPQAALAQGPDGNFYGTTSVGGTYNSGTVFKITPSGTLTTLYDFCALAVLCTDGENPAAPLVLGPDGNFYGTDAGAQGGTIFKITPGGTITTIFTFCFDCTNGGQIQPALLSATDGNLYGTTVGGGPNDNGTVFKITSNGALTTLYDFCAASASCTDGAGPETGLAQGTDGNFYGTTGTTIFQITPSGTLTTLYGFCSQAVNGICTAGAFPEAGLVQGTDGNFYGTTTTGGANCVCGTVFSLSTGLAPFLETLPTAGAVGTAVQIFGTNLAGATSVTFNGTAAVFKVVSSTLIATTVPASASTGNVQVTTPGGTLLGNVTFVVTQGTPPTITISGQVTLSGNGLSGVTVTLTGSPGGPVTTTTDASGDYSFTVAAGGSYTLTPSLGNNSFVPSNQTFTNLSANQTQNFTTTASLTTLYGFCFPPVSGPCPDGAYPEAALVQGIDGDFYGTTPQGGAGQCPSPGCGTVFKMTPSGTLTTLYSFCSQGGANCTDGFGAGGLVLATDGDFYGTTGGGGANGNGTVFKITPSGALATLYRFCSQSGCADGGGPTGLIQATDGNFYGTTCCGGTSGPPGTIFKITPSGTLTTLYRFCSQSYCADGSSPTALVQGSDGAFYGTTTGGGASVSLLNQVCVDSGGCGTIFTITPTGTLTTLYSFCPQAPCTDGYNPETGLVQGIDGNFYGTTVNGYGGGTVFQITPSGTLTTLHGFCSQSVGGVCLDGFAPKAPMIRGTDGNFYGSTSTTLFKINSGGTFTTLYNFCLEQCSYTGVGALTQGTDGNFYGTTAIPGFNSSGGAAFSLSVGLAPFVETLPTSGTLGTAVQILGTNLTGAASVTFNGTEAVFTVVSSTLITTTVPFGASTGEVQVTTSSGTLLSNVAFQVEAPPPLTIALSTAGQVEPFAAQSIVSAYGMNLAAGTGSASSLPLPTLLDGTTVTVTDSAGVARAASLFYVSPLQINFEIPAGTATGAASVNVQNKSGATQTATIQIGNVSPGLFELNASGLVAAWVLPVISGIQQSLQPVYQIASGAVVPLPINLGPSTEQTYLEMYGTGIRNANTVTATVGGISVPVLYAGPAPGFAGEDQVNIGPLPQSLAGAGSINIVLTAGGQAANTVNVTIQ